MCADELMVAMIDEGTSDFETRHGTVGAAFKAMSNENKNGLSLAVKDPAE
jgi:hypothetical protein